MIYFHASPINNLDVVGISPSATPHLSNDCCWNVYLGSYDYIINHFLEYAKADTYYIYKVNTSGLSLINDLPGEQVRTQDYIHPEAVRLFKTVDNRPLEHPRIDEYREWYREKGYEV